MKGSRNQRIKQSKAQSIDEKKYLFTWQ